MFDMFIHNNNYFYSHKNQLEYVFQKNIYNKQNQVFFFNQNCISFVVINIGICILFLFPYYYIFIMEKTNKPLNEEKKSYLGYLFCHL